MKNILLVLLLGLHFVCYSQKKGNLIYKIEYLPATNYFQIIEMTSTTELSYLGSDEFLQQLVNKGISNPTITKEQSTVESVFKVGELKEDNNYPIVIEYLKTTSADGKKAVPDGTRVHGHGSLTSLPILDSIVSVGLSESYKQTLLTTMQATFSQLTHKERKLKIGENFTVHTPLLIPILDFTIDMEIVTTYKLTAIKSQMAYFDIEQTYELKSMIEKYMLRAKGSGNGKLVHDILNNFNAEYQIDTLLDMNLEIDDFGLGVISKSSMIQKVDIQKK